MKRQLKKVLGIAVSAAMIAGYAIPSFAADPTTTAAEANVLAYSADTYLVPTQIKVALNPGGLTVTTKAAVEAADAEYEPVAEDAEFEEGTTYYIEDEENEGEFIEAEDLAEFEDGVTYYIEKTPAVEAADAVTTTSQIVSLNYGIANKSTKDKAVEVSFALAYKDASTAEGKKDVVFVDTAAKATAKSAENENGAEKGELKMYLAVAGSKAAPKVDESTAFAATKDATTKLYSDNVTAANLANVYMETATAENVAFAAGTTNIADAKIGFRLGKATYTVKEGQEVGFNTTQAALAEKVELSALGGIAGFTLVGAMNTDADWTTAKATAITITPTYKVVDATNETVLTTTNAGYLQISTVPAQPANAAPSVSSETASFTKGTALVITTNLGTGNLAATEIAKAQIGTSSTEFSATSDKVSISGNKVTVAGTCWAGVADGGKRYVRIEFNDTAKTVKVIEVTVNDAP